MRRVHTVLLRSCIKHGVGAQKKEFEQGTFNPRLLEFTPTPGLAAAQFDGGCCKIYLTVDLRAWVGAIDHLVIGPYA